MCLGPHSAQLGLAGNTSSATAAPPGDSGASEHK